MPYSEHPRKLYIVRQVRLELTPLSGLVFETSASTIPPLPRLGFRIPQPVLYATFSFAGTIRPFPGSYTSLCPLLIRLQVFYTPCSLASNNK